jgi:hypothetical protein
MVKRKRDANKIIVIGLPEGTDNEALEAMFADIGKVVKRTLSPCTEQKKSILVIHLPQLNHVF